MPLIFVDHILVYILHIFEFSFAYIFLFTSRCLHLEFILILMIPRWVLLLRFQLLGFWIHTIATTFHGVVITKRRIHLELASDDWTTHPSFNTLRFRNQVTHGTSWVYSTRLIDLEFRIGVFTVLWKEKRGKRMLSQSYHPEFAFKYLFLLIFVLLSWCWKNQFRTDPQSF